MMMMMMILDEVIGYRTTFKGNKGQEARIQQRIIYTDVGGPPAAADDE